MKVSSIIKSSSDHHKVSVSTDNITRRIEIDHKSSGQGSSVNGGELLMLSIATCFCNDLYREANKRNIAISSIEIEASGEFNAEGESGYNFTYKAKVTADVPQDEIAELIAHTDKVAEIHNTLRKGVSVALTK